MQLRLILPLLGTLLAAACNSSVGGGGGGGGSPDAAVGGGGSPDAAPVQATGENCASAILLDVSGGPMTVQGSTAGRVHDYDGPPACGVSMDEVDVVYQVQVPPATSITAVYTGTGTGADVIAVETACPDTTLIGGCTAGDPTVGLDATQDFPAGGLASIFVWSEPDTTFSLQVTLSAVP